MNTCIETTTKDDAAGTPARIPAGSPRLDVIETPEGYRLEVELPGAAREDVELGYERRILTVKARIPAHGGEARRYHLREFGPRELVRRIHVDETIDPSGIAAEVKNGLLTVRLPKVAAAQPRRIEVA